MKVRKDEAMTLLEFSSKINYPLYSKLALAASFIGGIIVYLFTKKVLYFFVPIVVGLIIYIYLAFNYRCPDCGAFLWNIRNKKKLKRCPMCQAKLKD